MLFRIYRFGPLKRIVQSLGSPVHTVVGIYNPKSEDEQNLRMQSVELSIGSVPAGPLSEISSTFRRISCLSTSTLNKSSDVSVSICQIFNHYSDSGSSHGLMVKSKVPAFCGRLLYCLPEARLDLGRLDLGTELERICSSDYSLF